jgi:hypothetical protein
MNCEDISGEAAMDARLREALGAELPDASRIERAVRRRISGERSRRWAIAAAAVVLLAAVLGYRMLRTERLFIEAAIDHRLEVTDHQPRHWRSDPAEIAKLAARYQLPDPAALAPEGYRLEHAKMCGLDGQPALHLVYTNGGGEVSLFVRAQTGGSRGPASTGVGDLKLGSFQNGRIQVIAAGGDCLEFVRRAAGVL